MHNEIANPERPGGKRPVTKIAKDYPDWCKDPVAIVRLALWMLDNAYERREVERMAEKPWNYEVEYIQCCLEAGVSV